MAEPLPYSALSKLRFMMKGEGSPELMQSQQEGLNRIAADPQYFLGGSDLRPPSATPMGLYNHLSRINPADMTPDEKRMAIQIGILNADGQIKRPQYNSYPPVMMK